MTARILFPCVALALSGCAPATAPAPPVHPANVLIVTIDTLRADRVGVYGATDVETPNIDRLAREGAWAPQANVHVPLTRPSHVSLFTGRYPAEHGIRDNVSPPLAADVPVLSERFQREGFSTAAFIASAVLDRQSGLARGFDRYSDRFPPGADRRPGDEIAAEAIAWMTAPASPKPGQANTPASPKPDKAKAGFFAWVHLYDPHAPYLPPEPYAARYAGRPYDGTVAWSDEIVGRIVTGLRDAGILDETLVIVTSDHGEALGDHGEDVHGYFVYEATLRVPLVVRGPGVKAGTRIEGVVRTIDLFPTIVEMAGLGGGTTTSGRSLAPALRGFDSAVGAASLTADSTRRPVLPRSPQAATRGIDEPSFAESLVPLLHYGWSDLRAVRDGRWKYILAPRPELYDLERDPGELHNLVEEESARARAMRASLEYLSGGTLMKVKSPLSSVNTSASFVPRVSLVRVTAAPGMMPPCASLTVPRTVPVVTCADAGAAIMQSASAAAAKVESLRTTIFSSLLRANAEDVWPESERRAHVGPLCRAENSSSATGWQADVSSTMMRG